MNSNARVTKLMAALVNGEALDTESVCIEYDISKRTFQRDLMVIKDALGERFEIKEQNGVWKLTTMSGDRRDMVVAIAHILLGSRGLASVELNDCVNWLLAQLGVEDFEAAQKQLHLARVDYLPMTEAKPLLSSLQQIEAAIAQSQLLTFDYRASTVSPATDHVVQVPQRDLLKTIKQAQPVAVFFEEHYWYAAMYVPEAEDFWLYRVDRIQSILGREPGVNFDCAQRFSLQDHRHRTYLLSFGEFGSFTFEYSEYPPTALDKFPQSKIIRHNPDGTVVIQAYAYLSGAAIWLMGQGPGVKVLEPPSLVALIKQKHQAALDRYQ
ncbi:helix-turn-helix transcriptional regulator [Lacticaseibacillus porcinae]|uniref:helix-turn-helix transcriptional regulator n=1 Tax=Lacticaseibacillus porcinae TaxID=1123687 RepID=UPI000F7B323C|nr:WYL domain-containing protein [Lacticaseibacillus porcinae]